jgi:hypothetical protein
MQFKGKFVPVLNYASYHEKEKKRNRGTTVCKTGLNTR